MLCIFQAACISIFVVHHHDYEIPFPNTYPFMDKSVDSSEYPLYERSVIS